MARPLRRAYWLLALGLVVIATVITLVLQRPDPEDLPPSVDFPGSHSNSKSPTVAESLDQPAESTTLLVRSEPDGSPIPKAEVVIRIGDGQSDKLITDDQGTVSIPVGVGLSIRCGHQGFADATFVGIADSLGLTIDLRPAGAIQLVFVDEADSPVEGLEAILLPPVPGGSDWTENWWIEVSHELDALAGQPFTRASKHIRAVDPSVLAAISLAEWKQRSDSSGSITWSALVPASGYRWGLVSNHALQMSPPHEKPEVTFTDSGITRDSGPPTGLSGKMDVEIGRTTKIVVRVYKSIRVAGRLTLPDGTPVRGATVKMYRRTRHEHVGELKAVTNQPEAHTRTSETGEFLFSRLVPGEKSLRAYFDSGDQNFHFWLQTFTLGIGESKQLGPLSPLSGSTLEGEVRVSSGGDDSLGVEDILELPSGSATAILSVNSIAAVAELGPAVAEKILVTLNSKFFLHGLPAGSCWLLAELGPGISSKSNPNRVLVEPELRETTVPLPEPVLLEFVSALSKTFTLSVLFPSAHAKCRVEVFFKAVDSQKVVTCSIKPRLLDQGNLETVDVVLSPGTYEVLAHSHGRGSVEPSPSLAAFSRVSLSGSSQTMPITLLPASTIEGTLQSSAGEVLPDALILFGLAEWSTARPRLWQYQVRTNEEGRYLVRGIVPGMTLVTSVSDSPMPVQPSPSALRIDLTKDR